MDGRLVLIGGGTGFARVGPLSVGLCAVDPSDSWRLASNTRRKAMPPIKLGSGPFGDVISLRDCSEAFRLGAGSPSGRVLEVWIGGVLEGFDCLGRKSGRVPMSCTLEGCSA